VMVPVLGTAGWYMQELSKDPPPLKLGFSANNSRVYDLLPKAAEPPLATQRAVRKGRCLPWVWPTCSPTSSPWPSMS
jgi:hypothetical protein